MRPTILSASVLAALCFSGSALATVSGEETSVTAGDVNATATIIYTARAGTQGAGFQAMVTDVDGIIVDGSISFEVFDAALAAFVPCDGLEKAQSFTVFIACDPTTGVYSVRSSSGDLPTLSNNMQAVFDVEVAAADGATATVGFGPYCTGIETPAINGCTAYFGADTLRIEAPAMPISATGTITVAGVVIDPVAPAVTFNPDGGAINLPANGGNAGGTSGAVAIAVAASGGAGAGSASFSCAVPAGFQVTNNADADILVGEDPADMSVTCTLGIAASSAGMACDVDDVGGARTENFTLNCPAGLPVPIAEFDSTPAAGEQITCSGAPGVVQNREITISNVGIAGAGSELDYTCTVTAGAPTFAIVSGGAGTVAVGGSATVAFTCTPPAEGAADVEGAITCTTPDDADEASNVFPLVSGAITTPPPIPSAAVIPANSLWSKLTLFGLLAGLGALVIAMRRH